MIKCRNHCANAKAMLDSAATTNILELDWFCTSIIFVLEK